MESFWVLDEHRRQNENNKNKKGIISSELVNKALEIAYNAYKDQSDAAGRPYILHIIHVAEQMQGERPVCCALLQGVLQNGVTTAELSEAGFSDDVIAIIKLLARDDATPLHDHVQSLKESGNVIAVNIALTGLLYDCDLSKFKVVNQQVVDWYYQHIQAIAILENDNGKNRWRESELQYIYDAVSTRVIDIKMHAPSIGARLSNLPRRLFVFGGIECESIEGVLQSFKFPDPSRQNELCRLHGFQAKKAGKAQDWQSSQTLYWQGEAFPRESQEYQQLLYSLYKAAFDQNEKFRKDLELSKGYKLLHSIGRDNPQETVLTRDEFISRLEWLRDLV